MESASAISCFNSVRLRVQLGKELASLLLSGRADTRFLIQQRMPSRPGKFQRAVPNWRPLRNDLFFGKFRRSRGSFLSRNEKRLRSQSPWYPGPPIAPVKRSFQLRVGGCGSHSVNRGRSVVSAPFGHAERCAENLLAMPNLSIAGRSRLLQGIAGGAEPASRVGDTLPDPCSRGHAIGPTERQSRNGRIISQ